MDGNNIRPHTQKFVPSEDLNAVWHYLIAGLALGQSGPIWVFFQKAVGLDQPVILIFYATNCQLRWAFVQPCLAQRNVSCRGWEIRTNGYAIDCDRSWATGYCATLWPIIRWCTNNGAFGYGFCLRTGHQWTPWYGNFVDAEPHVFKYIYYFIAPPNIKNFIWLGKLALAACGTGKIKQFSDSARSIHIMTKSINVPTKPISDWFHLAMRIKHAISVADTLEVSTVFTTNANKTVQASLRVMRTKLWKGDIATLIEPSVRSGHT